MVINKMATDKCTTIITGASSGIGAATARVLAKPDQALVLHARGGLDGKKIALLEALAEEVRSSDAEAMIVVSDLAEDGAATELVCQCIEHFGRLDRLVSNAGFALNKPIGELTLTELDLSYATITRAFLELTQAALPHLSQSSMARIVAVTSFVIDQTPGERIFPATAAAKGALQALAMSLAAQVATKGITVNCVAPGFTQKETVGHSALSSSAWQVAANLTPNRQLAKPVDIAYAIDFLLSERASHITGQSLRVDGGLSLL